MCVDLNIPDNLRSFLSLENVESNLAITSVVVDPNKKGELISIAALAEEAIAKVLVTTLSHPDRIALFEELLANQLTFHQKIVVVKKILPGLEADPSKYVPHLQFIAALKKMRNMAAHSYGMTPQRALKLGEDSEIVRLAGDFPNAAWSSLETMREYLDELTQ